MCNAFSRPTLTRGLALAILLVCGLLLRFSFLRLSSVWLDEGFSLQAILVVQKYLVPRLPTGFVYWHSYLYHLSALVPYLFTHDLILAARATAAFWGWLTIPLFYGLARLFRDEMTALSSTALFTFSYWAIVWSHQARGYTLLLFFFLLSLYWLVRYLKEGKRLFFSWAVLSAILSIFSHELGLFALIPLALVFFQSLTTRVERILCAASLFFALILFIVFQPNLWHFSLGAFFLHLTFLLQSYHLFFLGAVLWSALWLLEWRAARSKKVKADQMSELVLLVAFWSPLILLGFFYRVVHLRYLFLISPLTYLLGASFWVEQASQILREWQRWQKVAVVCLLTLAAFLLGGFVFWPQPHYRLEPGTPQPNLSQAYAKLQSLVNVSDHSSSIGVVSPYSALNQVMLGQPYAWFKYSLTGLSDAAEIYAGSDVIADEDGLAKYVKQNSNNYILLDSFAFVKIDPSLIEYVKRHATLIWQNQDPFYDETYLYQWQGLEHEEVRATTPS